MTVKTDLIEGDTKLTVQQTQNSRFLGFRPSIKPSFCSRLTLDTEKQVRLLCFVTGCRSTTVKVRNNIKSAFSHWWWEQICTLLEQCRQKLFCFWNPSCCGENVKTVQWGKEKGKALTFFYNIKYSWLNQQQSKPNLLLIKLKTSANFLYLDRVGVVWSDLIGNISKQKSQLVDGNTWHHLSTSNHREKAPAKTETQKPLMWNSRNCGRKQCVRAGPHYSY